MMKYLISAKKRKENSILSKFYRGKTKPSQAVQSAIKANKKAIELGRQNDFIERCRVSGLPTPIPEFQFAKNDGPHKGRRWAIDYYFEKGGKKLALEIEGGIGKIGRHQRPGGFRKDMEKYNALNEYGIQLFRVEPSTLFNVRTTDYIKRFFDEKNAL